MTCFNVAIFDDEDVSQLVSKISHENFEFHQIQPENFESDLNRLKKDLTFDAFIIDQKLSGDEHIQYSGTTIAQQLRTWMASAELNPVPIVLWSMDDRITSFENEHSSHNLIDWVWRKPDFINSSENIFPKQLNSLIDGYKLLSEFVKNKGSKPECLFDDDPDIFHLIPEDASEYITNQRNLKEHTLAQFILNGILRFDGPLISEATVAARLGISVDKSQNWESFKSEVLSEFQYKGIFDKLYPRFWSIPIEIWWTNLTKTQLAGLSGESRVKWLNEQFNYELTAEPPAMNHSEDHYWYSCFFTNAPIDPRDAFQLAFPQKRDWQDPLYCSFNSILERKHKEKGYELKPDDREKFLAIYRALKHGSQ